MTDTKHNNGGPAFPVGDQSLHPLLLGMSLEDYFAGQALEGILASGWLSRTFKDQAPSASHGEHVRMHAYTLAADAFDIAAVMVAEKRRREAAQADTK